MKRIEMFFLLLAVLFCISGFIFVSMISNSIANYIGKNGWDDFNGLFFPILYILLFVLVVFVLSRLLVRWPSIIELGIVIIGSTLSAFIVPWTILLTTELIHIPQFATCTILFSAAFPRDRMLAISLSALACVGDEWMQSFNPNRVLDINDIFLNWIGLFIGLIVWWAIDVTLTARRAKSSSSPAAS